MKDSASDEDGEEEAGDDDDCRKWRQDGDEWGKIKIKEKGPAAAAVD